MQVCAFCLQHSDCYCCYCCRETKESTLSQPQTRHKCWCVHVFMNQKRCSKSNYLPCTAHNRAPIGIESRETRGVNFSAKKVLNCLLFPSLYSTHPRFVCWTIDWLIFACWSNQVWVCVCVCCCSCCNEEIDDKRAVVPSSSMPVPNCCSSKGNQLRLRAKKQT